MAKANVTGGTIGGAVGKSGTANVTGGKIGGPVDVKKIKNAPIVLPGMPVSMQKYLTDKQKQEAAISRGFNSASEEAAYQKNNPNLYAILGGKKYQEAGYAALKNPQSVITPNNLTEEGKSAIKAAQDADAQVKFGNLPIRGKETTNLTDLLNDKADVYNLSEWFKERAKSEENYNRTYAPRKVLRDIIATAAKSDKKAAIESGDFSSHPDSQKVTDLKKSYWDTYTDEADFEKTPILDKYVTPFRTEKTQKILSYLDAKGLKSKLKEYQDFLKIEEDKARVQFDLETKKKKYSADKLSAVTDSVKSVPANMIGGVLAEGSNIVQGVTNELGVGTGNINVYDGWHMLANYAINTREAVTENIDSKIGKFAYQTGMSMADSAVTALIAQGLGVLGVSSTVASALATIPMASAAANMTTREMLEEGYTPQQAFRMGVASGFAEFITEKYSVEKLLNIGSSASIKEMIFNICKQALAEGSEEVTSNILNRIFEAGILGSESHNNRLLRYYIESGLTEKEAYVEVLKNNLYDDFIAFAGGAISGGLMGGGTTIIKTSITENKLGKTAVKNGTEGVIIDTALSLPESTDAYKYASRVGNEFNGRQIGKVALLVNEYINNSKSDLIYDAVYNRALELGAEKADANAIADYKIGVETQQFSEVKELLDAYKNATSSRAGTIIIDELSSEQPPQWVKELNTNLSVVYAAETNLREALNDSDRDTDTETENPELTQAEEDVTSEADNAFDEITETDNAGDDLGADTVDNIEAGKITSESGEVNVSQPAEESLFTEPEKREIFEDKISGKGLTITQQHIEELAKKLDPGLKIKWDPDLEKNGSFNPYNKILSLRANMSTAEAYIEFFKHEFMHDLELRGDYDKFLNYLENKSIAFAQYAKSVLNDAGREYRGGNAGAVKALFDYYYEMYTTDERIRPVHRQAFTIKDAKYEAAADFFADVLFKGKEYRGKIAGALRAEEYDNIRYEGDYDTSLSALQELAHKDKNLFHKVIDAIKRFIERLKGPKQTRKLIADLQKLERKLQDVYESAETNRPTEDGGVKWSIKNILDDKGNSYGIGVFLDSELLSNLSERERIKKVKEYVRAIGGKSFTAFDKNGNQIQIRIAKSNEKFKNKIGKVVPVNKDLTTKYNKNIVKQESVVLVDELIATARQENTEPSKYPHGWLDNNGNNDWDKWTTFIQDKNKTIWQATLHIANTNSGEKILYDISTIIKVERSGKSDTNSTAISISENSQKSQEKVSDNENITKTETFKKWFGSSKAVNKDGTPKKLYHRTNADFTVFDTERSGSNQGKTKGDGIYLSSSKDDFSYAGDKVMELYANIKSPFEMELSEKEANQIYDKYFKPYHEDKYNSYRPHVISSLTNPVKVFDYLSEAAETNNTKTSAILSELGYDGVHSGSEWVAFNPEQVKSADLVTYDDNGNVIPLSDRFNAENEDIRYSLKGDRLEELRYRPEMFAKRLIKQFNLKNVNVDELAGKLRKLVVKHNKGGNDWNINSEGEWEKVPVIDNLIDELSKDLAGYIKRNRYSEADEVLKYIRNTSVYIDKIQRQEILSHYGTLSNFRKNSKLKITPSANISLDSMWQEWAELYPEWFSKETNAADMPEEFNRIVNGLESSVEEIDEDLAAEYIAKEIKDVLDNTGTRARNREKGLAVNEAVKKARADEREKADKRFDDYRKKESERKYNEAVSKRKREYRDKALKLRDKYTKMLENPKKGSHIPQQFIKSVVDALDIVYDNPIDYDDGKIGGKYYARLEKLNQDIQNTADEQTRAELKEQYDRLYRTATNVGDRVLEIKKMLDALKEEDAYSKVYKDSGDDILFPARNEMYSDVMSKMLETLARELGDTEAYNYNEHQLRIISEVFTALDKHISDYNKLIVQKERIEVSEAADRLIEEIIASHGDFSLFNTAILAQASPHSVFNMLGNYLENSQALALFNMLNEGENKAISFLMKSEEMVKREILDDPKLLKETQRLSSIKEKDLVDSGLVDKNGNKVMVTKGMRLGLAMTGLNEQNRKALTEGGAEIPKDLKDYYKNGASASKGDVFKAVIPQNMDTLAWYSKLSSELTDIEKRWIKVFQKYYSEISAPALNEVTMQLFGFKRATVQNYWRILRTDHFLNKPMETVIRDSMLEHAGYLEKRKNSGNPIYLIDAIDQFRQDMDNHSKYYGLVIPLSNFSKVYNYAQFDFESGKWGSSVKSTIDDKYSKQGVTKYIEDLIADLNSARQREVSWFDRVRGRYAQAVLSLNPRVAVKQTASYPTAAAVIGWKPLIKALAVVEKDKGGKSFVFARAELDEIKKYSPLLWYRMRGNMDAELGNIRESGNVGDKLAKKMPAVLGWINKMDAATVGRLWYASKYYVEDNFKYEKGSPQYYKKTAEIFEKVIEETQPNYTVMQRPAVLRSQNALFRATTMFYTQRLQNANILLDAAMDVNAKEKAVKNATTEQGKALAKADLREARAKLGRAISSQVVSNIVLNVMELAIRAALSQMNPFRDKDDEVTEAEIWQGLGDGALDTMFGTVLFGSEIYEAAKLFIGIKKGQNYGIQVPVIETINDFANAIIEDGKFVNNTSERIKEGKFSASEFAEELTQRTLDTLIKTAQPLTGIPIKNAKDMISGIVHTAMDVFAGDIFGFEAAVGNNEYNRLMGVKTRTTTQYYRTLAEAVINDDKEKYDSTLKRLFKNYSLDTEAAYPGIKEALKASEAVKAEAKEQISEVKSNKTYKGLTQAGKDDIDAEIRDAIAKEKLLKTKKDRSKKFDKLYEYSRYRDKSDFNKLKKELISEGFSDKDIEAGLEIAKFKLLKKDGISVAEWFAAKKALSEQNARKNAEKFQAIQKMDFSVNDKDTLWEYLR